MKRIITSAAIAFAAVTVTAGAASASVTPVPGTGITTKTAMCYVPNPNTASCLSAPHTGGSGTPITLQTWKPQGSANQQWGIRQDTSFCNGKGVVSSGCGLPGFLVSRYSSDGVVVFENGSGRCLKINGAGSGSGLATIGTCFTNNTLLILANCTNSNCFYPSIAESELVGSTQWVCPPPVGRQVYAGSGTNCHAGNWVLVTP